jgi:Mg-chelatase subunit ChlD
MSGIINLKATTYTEIAVCNKKKSLFASVIEVPTNDQVKRTDVVLVVDRSGSMADSMKSVRAILFAVYDLLTTRGNLTVIAFNETTEVIYSSTMETRNEDLKLDKCQYDTAVEKLSSRGCTNISDALIKAFTFQGKGQTLIICISDGEPNEGLSTRGEFAKLVKEKKNYNTLVNTIGLGTNYDTRILGAMGQMTHIHDIEMAPRVIGSMIGLFSSSVGYDATLELYDYDLKSIVFKYEVGLLYAEQRFKVVSPIHPDESTRYLGKAISLIYRDSNGVTKNVTEIIRGGENIPDEIKLVYYEKQTSNLLIELSRSKKNAFMHSNRVSKWPKLAESYANEVLKACVQQTSIYDAAKFESNCEYQVGYYDEQMQTSAQKRDGESLGRSTSSYLQSDSKIMQIPLPLDETYRQMEYDDDYTQKDVFEI